MSGNPLPNPWAKGSEDLRAQSLLQKRDEKLAEHYKKMATDLTADLSN